MTGRPGSDAALDARTAIAVIGGASLVTAGLGSLVLVRDAGPIPFELVAAAIGFALIAVGLARAALRLSPEELPPLPLSFAFLVFGILGLLFARNVFDWPMQYTSTDPRSQPANVLAAALFFGLWPAVLAIVGTVLMLARLRGQRS